MNQNFITIAIIVVLFGDAPVLRADSTQTTAQATSPQQSAQGQFDFGVQLMRDNKWAGAAQAFERATQARTNFPQAYNNWGICLVQLGKQGLNGPAQLQSFQAAADKFSKAAAQKPDDNLTYILWSETLLLIGDLPVESRTRLACYQGAVEKCRKAAALAPDDWEPYNKWAVILSTKLPDYAADDQARYQLYTEAASLFAKAADRTRFSGEIGPVYDNWAGALVRAARVSPDREEKQSLLREALEKFERAAKAHPSVPATYAMWGNALIDLGKLSRIRADFRAAIEKLNTSLALHPDDPAALYSLARAYAQLDDPVMSAANLKKCFDLDPNQTYRQSIAQDGDFSSVRHSPQFDELMDVSVPRGLPTTNPQITDSPR